MIKVKDRIYLSVPEAAKLIDRSTQFVYMYHKQYWNTFRYGQSILFDKEQLEVWMENKLRKVSK